MEVRAALGVRERARDMPLRGLEHVVEGDRMHQDPSIGVEHRDPRPVLAERGPYQVVRLRDAPDSFPQRFSAAIEGEEA
jgi:hypothetical protein